MLSLSLSSVCKWSSLLLFKKKCNTTLLFLHSGLDGELALGEGVVTRQGARRLLALLRGLQRQTNRAGLLLS